MEGKGLNWDQIFKKEEGEKYVGAVVEEIIQKAGSIVYERYNQKRVVPFAVQRAKKDILGIVEVN